MDWLYPGVFLLGQTPTHSLGLIFIEFPLSITHTLFKNIIGY